MNIESNTSNFVLKKLLKISYAVLSVLKLSALVCININQLSTRNQVYNINYCRGWITVLGIPGFNLTEAIELGYICLIWWLVAWLAPGHYLTHYNPPERTSMNIEPNTPNFVLKILSKVSFAALIVLNLSSLIWININPLSTVKPSYYLLTMTTWTTVTSVSAFEPTLVQLVACRLFQCQAIISTNVHQWILNQIWRISFKMRL